MSINFASTLSAPTPGGHYSQATIHNGLIYVSGQLPIAADGSRSDLSFEEQTGLALANVLAIVEAAGGRADTILKVTAYIVGIENWPIFDGRYARAFGDHRPARAIVPVPALHYGFLVEIDAIACQT